MARPAKIPSSEAGNASVTRIMLPTIPILTKIDRARTLVHWGGKPNLSFMLQHPASFKIPQGLQSFPEGGIVKIRSIRVSSKGNVVRREFVQ